MRSMRSNHPPKWDPHSLEASAANAKHHPNSHLQYSSSDEDELENDERIRLNHKRHNHIYSSGSPNESDNTYAEANLLTGVNMQNRYEDGKGIVFGL